MSNKIVRSNSQSKYSTMKDFEIISHLGSGSYGTVYKVKKYVNNNIYVIKTIPILNVSYDEQTTALNEVKILAQMNCPYIVKYYDSFIDNSNLNIVMEYCNKGDLQSLLKKSNKNIDTKQTITNGLKEKVTWNIILQVILGLHYLHNNRVLHRDLKTANVFLSKQEDIKTSYFQVKIGDLGVAKLLDSSTAFAQTMVGTPYYLSPELCSNKPYRDKSDCWALGVIIYECCTLRHPFEATNQFALIMKILQSPLVPPNPQFISPELTKLLFWLLQKDPNKRPTIKEILTEKIVKQKLDENNFPIPMDIDNEPETDILGYNKKINGNKKINTKSSNIDMATTTIQPMKTITSGIRGGRVRGSSTSNQFISEKARVRHQVKVSNHSESKWNDNNNINIQQNKKVINNNNESKWIDNNININKINETKENKEIIEDLTEYEYHDDFEELDENDDDNNITIELEKHINNINHNNINISDSKENPIDIEEELILVDDNIEPKESLESAISNDETISVDVNQEIFAIKSLLKDAKIRSKESLGDELFEKLYDICNNYKLINDKETNSNNELVKELEDLLCNQLKLNTDVAVEAIFNMKVLLAFEERLDLLLNK